ncbi:nitroreductase family protein [Candidatus Saccharibacteria bacterium]|nr:nitroreductase family protein [Candidatus Saccharibacteria bacterium]
MDLVKKYESFGSYENDFAYMNAINILRGYVNFYKEKGWTDTDEYKNVSLFIKQRKGINKINAGSFILRKKDFEKDAKIDFAKFLASRHSVREFKKAKINESDFKKAVQIAALSPSACNRQMCKAYLISNELKNKRVIKIGQGFGGFEKDTINTIIVTFDVNANCSIGERNQGWFNAGLFSMNLVNAMHSLGIGSCFCQFSNSSKEEQSIKELLNIPVNERIAVIIACGYYVDECKIPYSPRKSVDDIYRKI